MWAGLGCDHFDFVFFIAVLSDQIILRMAKYAWLRVRICFLMLFAMKYEEGSVGLCRHPASLMPGHGRLFPRLQASFSVVSPSLYRHQIRGFNSPRLEWGSLSQYLRTGLGV